MRTKTACGELVMFKFKGLKPISLQTDKKTWPVFIRYGVTPDKLRYDLPVEATLRYKERVNKP